LACTTRIDPALIYASRTRECRQPESPPKVRNTAWSAPTTWDEVKRRAVGRYKYNAIRRVQAQLRRREVLRLLGEWGWVAGVQSRMAEALQVHRSTICRDLKVIMPLMDECPTCHQLKPRDWWAS
jgi:hypothetical protein